jgi:hypothetical protein
MRLALKSLSPQHAHTAGDTETPGNPGSAPNYTKCWPPGDLARASAGRGACDPFSCPTHLLHQPIIGEHPGCSWAEKMGEAPGMAPSARHAKRRHAGNPWPQKQRGQPCDCLQRAKSRLLQQSDRPMTSAPQHDAGAGCRPLRRRSCCAWQHKRARWTRMACARAPAGQAHT